MSKRLGAEFERFAKCIPSSAGEAQRWDMQMAFYAGASSLFKLSLSGLTPDAEPTQEDLIMMDNLHTELVDFGDLVKVKIAQREA